MVIPKSRTESHLSRGVPPFRLQQPVLLKPLQDDSIGEARKPEVDPMQQPHLEGQNQLPLSLSHRIENLPGHLIRVEPTFLAQALLSVDRPGVVHERRGEAARADGEYVDVIGFQLQPQRLGEALDGKLRRRVDRAAWESSQTEDRRDEHEMSAVLFTEIRERCLREMKRTGEVDLKGLLRFLEW